MPTKMLREYLGVSYHLIRETFLSVAIIQYYSYYTFSTGNKTDRICIPKMEKKEPL